MPSAKTFSIIAMVALLSPAALAQPVSTAPVVAAPPAWTISADPARGIAQIASTARNGGASFVGGCDKLSDPGFLGSFSRYRGTGLRTDGESERVLFYVRGDEWQEAFSAQLRYSASSGTWEIVKPLPPAFVNSFSRGATLAVVNSRRQDVMTFDLAGSTAAARAMRSACGLS